MTSGASQLSGEILCELDCLLANLGHSCCFLRSTASSQRTGRVNSRTKNWGGDNNM